MKRKLVFVTAFLTLFLVLTTNLTTNVYAAPALTRSSSSDLNTMSKGVLKTSSAPQTVCNVYNVGLNGSEPATITCLHSDKVVSGKIVSDLTQTTPNCDGGELQLFADAN